MILFMLFCIILLVYVWVGYPAAIIFLSRFIATRKPGASLNEWPGISVVIAARNEGNRIGKRIKNLLASDYPGPIEIVVASDGSTDNTAEAVKAFAQENVRVIEYPKNRGRAMVHNDSVPLCSHAIIVFTDAETSFESNCLRKLIEPFANPDIGCTVGKILYDNSGTTGISESAGLYWQMEEAIRKAESSLAILGFGTGACTAMRKHLFCPMQPWEDLDYAATLMLVINGARIQYVPDAIAHDVISESPQAAFRTRVRQTSRSFVSIINRTIPAFFTKRFGILIASLSHKTGRHLSPFFLLGALLSSALAFFDHYLAQFVLFTLSLFFITAFAGYATNKSKHRFRLGAVALSFFILNLARGVGVIRALTNKRVTVYETQI